MTPQIIMRQSHDPTTCMCCGRHAASIGAWINKTRKIAWTCDNPKCMQATKVLIMQKPDELNRIEQRAIEAVARHKINDLMGTVINAMHDAGATDLNNITEDQANLAMDSLLVNSAIQEEVRSIVLAFGDAIRADVTNGESPF